MSRNSLMLPVLAANSYHQATLIALVPVLLNLFQVNIQVLGAFVGVSLALSGAAMPVWGYLADRIGLDRALRAVFACSLIAVLLLAGFAALASHQYLAPPLAFAGFLLGRLVYCLSAPAVLPIGQARLAQQDRAPDALLGAIARLNVANGIGRIAGNISVVLLLGLGGSAVVVIAAPLPVYIVCFVASMATGSSTASPSAVPPQKTAVPDRLPVEVFLRFAAACMVQLSIGMAYILIGPLIQLVLDVDAEAGSGLAGLCLAIAIGAALLAHIFLKRLLGQRQFAGQLVAAFMGAAGLVGLALADTTIQIILAVTSLSVAAATLLSINVAQALIRVPDSMSARASALLSSAQFWGLAAGSALGGVLGGVSLPLAYMVGSACFLLAGLVAALFSFLWQQDDPAAPHHSKTSVPSH